ncbi:hypothetical protein [Tenacibaculum aiptasiae]|uniref:hypothetical protein n=1 Tax=Tenacibaculum aiptasiae TaxID=426481 RepID=UPI00232AAAE0|nr:hypothetical protein [Tenacibaculum aiptasiae]
MNTFILKTGKGKYGVGGKQIQGVDIVNISQDPTALVQALVRESFEELPDLSILRIITPQLIEKWNKGQFTESEVKKLKTFISWRSILISFNNFKDKNSIPPFPWTNGSNIVTLKNYNNGSVSGNYLLVSSAVSSNNINWLYLKESNKISIHYYDEENKTPDAFILEKTTEIVLAGYVVYKVIGATPNARFTTFTPDTDGAYSKNIQVNSL